MGNALQRVTAYLSDPYLVRAIQEKFGIQQITFNQASDQKHDASSTNRQIDLDSETPDQTKPSSKNNGWLINGKMDWLPTTKKVHRRIKRSPSISPASSPPSSPEPEDISSTPEIVVESVPFLDNYFRLATELGYEPFYITFIPFILWNIDVLVGRHVIILWVMSMYIGQACKQLFKIKRPASPPALRLEDNPDLETEYGFPSTHAIIATTLPFYCFYCCFGRYEFPAWLGLLMACGWCFSVCASRIYLGVHSLLDICGGIVISVGMLLLVVPFIDQVDHYILYHKYQGLVALFLIIFLLYIYPVDPTKWTMDRGDTAAILGIGLGITWAFWVHGPYPDDLESGPYAMYVPSLNMIAVSIVRFVVGILLLLPTRFVMKLLCFKLLPFIMPTHGVQEVVKRPLVELPYKIITYGAIGFNAIYLAPILFEICNISRWEVGSAYSSILYLD